MKWLIPWHPVHDRATADGLAHELRAELCKSHVLYGLPVRAIGRRQDCDDVLFELLDGSGRFAVVHLAYAQQPEVDPQWPDTTLYSNWTHFEKNGMQKDAHG